MHARLHGEVHTSDHINGAADGNCKQSSNACSQAADKPKPDEVAASNSVWQMFLSSASQAAPLDSKKETTPKFSAAAQLCTR